MKLQNTNKSAKTNTTIIVTPWATKPEVEPRQSVTSELKFNVNINGKSHKVSHNKSKSGITYQYVLIEGIWNWTRDTFTKDAKYVTYVKPVKVKGELNKSTAAQELGLEVK